MSDQHLADFERFARHLYGEQTGYLCVVAGRRQGGRLAGVETAYYAYPATVGNAWGWLTRRADDGKDTYVCVHLLRDRRRVKENAAPIACLWCDGDTAAIPDGTGPYRVPRPTMIVETSPGRWHGYWRLDRLADPAKAEELNRRLTYAIGADKGGWDLGQLVRPPGLPNYKYPDRTITSILGAEVRS
jgi:hypothetical protein